MLYDLTVSDACFAEGHAPQDIDEVFGWARHRLGPAARSWRLISARRKLGRTLFEIEEETPSGPRRLIGKLGHPEREATLYRTLAALRDAGFRPPAKFTVPEPVAYLAERGFVLQEKAPGNSAGGAVAAGGEAAESTAMDCARWLARLHGCPVAAKQDTIDEQAVSHWALELQAVEPSEARRIEKIIQAVLHRSVERIIKILPSHGDFHPGNIFIAGSERVTGIDIDKFAHREPEADIGWFLMQTAAFGFFERGSFECTAAARRAFLDSYELQARTPIRADRAALYMALAFLKNLHFELVLLNTGRKQFAEPWLWAAETAILDGNPQLSR
jgi:aminoglycoside phosphotransferase (APT) family kinase protein